MINGSTAFNNAVAAGGHPYTARISYNGTVVDCDVISCTISKGATGNEAFSVGGCFVPYIEMEVRELDTILENKEVKLEVGVYTNSTNIEWITIGYFIVTKVSKSTVKTTFTALGRIAGVLSIITPTLTTPTTISSVISDVQAAVRAEGYTSFTISTGTVVTTGGEITEPLSGLNARQLLEIVAGCVGGYLTEDNAGNAVIFKYNTSSTVAYNGSRMITHPTYNDYNYSLTNIKVIQQESYELEDGTVVPEVSYIYDSTQPYDWVILNRYMASQSMFNAFCSNCIGLTYRPAVIELAEGDPRLEAVDVLSITDTDSSVYIVPGMSVTHVITGGIKTTIVAPGKSEAEADSEFKGPITQQLDIMSSSVQTAKIAAMAAQSAAAEAQEVLDGMKTAAQEAGTTLEGIYQTARDVDEATHGTITYEYDNQGVIETVYRQRDGTYYYIYTDGQTTIQVVVDEEDLVGYPAPVTNRQPDGLDTAVDQARQAAEDAADSAWLAASGARVALDQLSIVQDVVGVLDLLTEQGTYEETKDLAVEAGKWYFIRHGVAPNYVYEVVENVTSLYHLTEDTSIDTTKNYYTRSGSGTTEDPYVYTKVQTPVVADIGTYYEKYYELTGIKEAAENYITSKLAVTERGLWLQNGDTSQTKVLLSSVDGVVLYGPDGHIVGQYGKDAQIGDVDGFHMLIGAVYVEVGTPLGDPSTNGYLEKVIVGSPEGNPKEQGWYEEYNDGKLLRITNDLEVNPNTTYYQLIRSVDTVVDPSKPYYVEQMRLSFLNKATEIAYMSNDELYITKSVVLQQMDLGIKQVDGGLGQWTWIVHENNNHLNNLCLKWIG